MKHINPFSRASSGNDWYLKHHASSDLSGAPSQHLCGHLWLWDLSLCFKPDILLLLYQVRVTVFSRTARVDCADPKTLLCDWTSSVLSVTDWQTRSRKDFLWTHALPNSNNSGLDCISVLFVHDAIFDQRLLANIMSNTELQTLLRQISLETYDTAAFVYTATVISKGKNSIEHLYFKIHLFLNQSLLMNCMSCCSLQ